jgi:hypothetical protein
MKKKVVGILLFCIITTTLPVRASAEGFTDVPADSWAQGYIQRAVELGIMGGYGGGVFGYGSSVTRAEFAAMLVRLFNWTPYSPETPSFEDNADKTAWYFDEIETAVHNGAVTPGGGAFRPDEAITREEMAVMLVRGLGYAGLADSLRNVRTPFTDVSSNITYIAMAYDFGIITGTSAAAFSPQAPATREQAAAMMLRLYDRYHSKTDWTHAYYAVGSYAQKELISGFDAVSFGWSRLEFDEVSGAVLNMTGSGGNPYAVPNGYEEVLGLAVSGGVHRSLSVFMSAARKMTLTDGAVTDPCSAILLNAGQRTRAVAQILAALQHDVSYTGVTVDFEELRGDALKDGLNRFLEELNQALEPLGYTMNVCVHPVTSDGIFYDGYDYQTIGTLADKVILMAHDYAAASLTASEMAAGFTATPLTPFYEIYTALRAVTDETTGVADRSKIVLAVSFDSRQWKTVDGKVINAQAYQPDAAAIAARMQDPAAVMNYSEKYQNPYITYHNTTDHTDNIIWYEDARSIEAKAALARMFGISSLSFWRLGLIPEYKNPAGTPIYYDIPAWLEETC